MHIMRDADASALRNNNHSLFLLFRSPLSYSDGCRGQNKNNSIIGFSAQLTNSGMYHHIDHKFLERGYTYSQID